MKYIKSSLFLMFVFAIFGMTSCLKKDSMNIDPSNKTGNVMTLQWIENGNGTTINSGLQYFGGGSLTYPGSDVSDTANYNINLAGPGALSKDLNVTVGVDPTKLVDNYSADSISYDLMPDSLYKFITTTAVIKAGTTVANMQIVFYPNKINITKSYMLPVVIKDASGQTISSNFGTIYFHVIGNPLAGTYTRLYTRWNNGTGTGAPTTVSTTTLSGLPDNPTSIEFQSGYGDQNGFNCRYKVTFRNVGGVLSNFAVVINPTDVANSLNANSITLSANASVVLADLVNNHFIFSYKVINGAGAPRTFTDEFTKQ